MKSPQRERQARGDGTTAAHSPTHIGTYGHVSMLECMDTEDNDTGQGDGKRRRKGTTYGVATALGVGVGVALYSATALPDWLAVGIGVAIWAGVVMEGRSKK